MRSSTVTKSQFGVKSYQWRVSLHSTFWRGGLHINILVLTIELPKRRFQTFIDIPYPRICCVFNLKVGKSIAFRINRSLEEQSLASRMSCEMKTPYAGEDGIKERL